MSRDDTKLLQAILSNQNALYEKVDKLDKRVGVGFEQINDRLDKRGSQLAYLEVAVYK